MPKDNPRSQEELVSAENMLDNMIHEFSQVEGIEEEVREMQTAQFKMHRKLKELYPNAKWSFS